MQVKLNGNNFFQVSSPFGSTDYMHPVPHSGIDLIMETGTKLFSPVNGVVEKVVDYGTENIGKGIIIKTNGGQNVIMGHLSNVKASVGQKVHEGDFVALSGNTGHSSGSHLHLGLKDASGNVLNPDSLMVSGDDGGGIVDSAMSFGGFLKEWHNSGSFWQAMYGKSFFDVMKDFTVDLINDIYTYIISNGDLFFIMPAVIIMFATFFIGRNRFTKWIIPLWFTYFVSVVLNIIRCMPPQ